MGEPMTANSGWSETKLATIIKTLASGASVNGESRPAIGNEVGVLKVSCVSDGRFFPGENKAVIAEDLARVRLSVAKGDLLVSRANTFDLIGACGFVTADYPQLYLPDKLWKVVLRNPAADCAEWLLHVLNSTAMRQSLKDRATGTSGSMKNIPQESFLAIVILRPPISEQRKIAAVLSTWDRAIEKLIAAKRQRKAALMQRLLTGKVRLPGFAGEWNRVSLSEVGFFSKGFGFSKADIIAVGKPAIRYGELYTTHDTVIRRICSFITDEQATQSKEIRCGDILFPCSGETADEIGRPSVYLDTNTVYAGGDIIVLSPKRGDPLFLAYALNAADAFRHRASHAKGQSVVHIYIPDLQGYQCPFPQLAEQNAIAKMLNAADEEIVLHRRTLDALRRQKKGLMQQLLTGKVRVAVTEVESEPGPTVPG